jgi:uncharacterized protein (TIGR02996 family)
MSQREEEAALIRGIVAAPDDDARRLVYADWLEDHGREPRARLIRIQCEVERLHGEERELIERYGREWGAPLFDAGVEHFAFHRGFPEEIVMRFTDFLGAHARLNDVTPLSSLHLIGGTDENCLQLANLPAAHQIRSLEVGRRNQDETYLGVEGVRSLSVSPHLGGLRSLTLNSPAIGIQGASIIARATAFGNLTHLAITDRNLRNIESERLHRLINALPSKMTELQIGDFTFGSRLLQSMRLEPSGGRGNAG